MKHSTFFWFVLPSAFLMLLFIALPVASVVTQSLYTAHEQGGKLWAIWLQARHLN